MLHDLSTRRQAALFAKQPPRVWLMMGHKAGDNSQVLALAEGLGWPFEIKYFSYRRTELLSNLLLGPTLAGVVKSKSSQLGAPWPDLIISAGRRNEPVCRWIQKKAKEQGQRVRLVHCGRSWAKIERFDLIVTTPQYRLPQRPNILHNATPLHRVTEERLRVAGEEWGPRLKHLPKPHVAVIVGGSSGPYTFDQATAERLGREASAFAKSIGGSLLVTTSARTPKDKIRDFERQLDAPHQLFRWSKTAPENPYFGFLALADSIIVTGDSMSMITEACATRKPVYIFDLGVGPHAMRGTVNGVASADDALAACHNGREKGHLKAFIYRHTMRIGPQRMTRDIRIVHRLLVENGQAAWLGDLFPEGIVPAVDSVTRAVARVRALFGLAALEGRTPLEDQGEARLLRTAS